MMAEATERQNSNSKGEKKKKKKKDGQKPVILLHTEAITEI